MDVRVWIIILNIAATSMDKPTLNIEWMFNKLRPYISGDALSVKTINCLNYYRHLEEMSKEKNYEEVHKQLRMFEIFMKKMNDILNQISHINEEAGPNTGEIKSKIEIRRKQIQNKLESFDLKVSKEQKKMTGSGRRQRKQEKKNAPDQEQVFQDQLLERVKDMKEGAINIRRALDDSKDIIEKAKSNQEYVQDLIKKVTRSLGKMLSNPDLSIFKLIFMSVIALLLFLFTALFILAF